MAGHLSGGELAAGQFELAGNDVLAGLEHTAEYIKDGQWEDAVESLARVMENHGAALISAPVSARAESLGFGKLTTVTEHCQRELASWRDRAPQALQAYRQRVDELAARWLAAATRDRDEAGLQRIVDEFILSSSGDQALWLLGESALARGDYAAARHAWERISPQLRVPPAVAQALNCSPGCSWWVALQTCSLDSVWPRVSAALNEPLGTPGWLVYPDTDLPLAGVRARLVLVSLLQGDQARAAVEADLLARLHPEEEGELAGRRGKYTELVSELLREADSWPLPPVPEGWKTLGGSAQRNKVVSHSVDLAARCAWHTALPRLADENDLLAAGRLRVGERADGLLSYDVAVSDGVVFVQQPGVVRALRIDTGEPAWPFHAAGRSRDDDTYGAIYQHPRPPTEVLPRQAAHVGVPRYGVTVHNHRLFARLGAAWTGGDPAAVRGDQRSFLLGIDLRTQKLLFDPILPGEAGWEFESAPVATDACLYVTLRRREPSNAQLCVVCYSASTGKLIWRRDLVRGEAIGGAVYEIANGALTLSEGVLYCNTNLGAVVAVRAEDGRVNWVVRYPRDGLRGTQLELDDRHWARDRTPCLIHQDLLIAAPADCNRIFAVDTAWGQLVWATAAELAADATQLAGVGHGRLIACGDQLYWIDVSSGRLSGRFPAAGSVLKGFAGPQPRGHGRAVLAGDLVYWPTYDKIFVFQQGSDRQARQPLELRELGLTGGNLVIDGDTLLIAAADRLAALSTSNRGTNKVAFRSAQVAHWAERMRGEQ